ncbi:MAG TPA: porin [Burkholderiales bacterium]
MRRTALAVAVGGLFMAPAAQAQITFGNEQLGTLQIYGKLYPQVGWGSSKDATQPGARVSNLVTGTASNTLGGTTPITSPGARRAVDTQNSYLGFRGERDLASVGAGLKFIWQLEQSVNFDNPDCGANGGANTACAGFSTRNSFLGARTRFGTVKLGIMDTIYKDYGDTMQMFGISSGNFVSASNMLSHIGVGRSNTARFHERQPNSIQYETPQFAGFTGGYQYSPDESRITSGGGTDASLHSYGVKWDSRRFYVSVHQEIHNDRFGGSNNSVAALSNVGTSGAHSRDTGNRLSAEWRYSENQRVVFDISRLRYRERGQVTTAPKFEAYTHSTWAIGWDGGFGGPLRLAVQFIRGNEGNCSITNGIACSTTGLTGSQLNAGVRWRFDRQTFIYAIGSKLQNGPSARYDNWAAADPARGADILQGAIGVSYTF